LSAAGALFVKICGITRVEDAEAAIAAGASAIGLNFVPTSGRRVDEDVARAIARVAAGRISIVGVIQDLTPADALALRDRIGLDRLQLHGDESRDVVEALLPRAFKAVSVGGEEDIRLAEALPGELLLLDAKVPGERGGTGVTFDWALAAPVARRRRVLLAGGLTLQNVARAVSTVRPFGIDVASGVESAPGIKDGGKILAFRDRICPTGKMGDAWDVAHASVFLATDEAKYITGACLVIDGGLSGTAFVAA